MPLSTKDVPIPINTAIIPMRPKSIGPNQRANKIIVIKESKGVHKIQCLKNILETVPRPTSLLLKDEILHYGIAKKLTLFLYLCDTSFHACVKLCLRIII